MGTITEWRLFGRFWHRALFFSAIAAIFLALAFFPQRYRASATLTPADPSTMGLSGTLGQLGALDSVFGKQADVEVALRVGTSIYTRQRVINELHLTKRMDKDQLHLHRWLTDHVSVRSLRGGIIQIDLENRDAELARDIVAAYARATRERLAVIMRRQTEYKRQVLEKLVSDASDRLDKAQSAYNAFRLANGYADPDVSLESMNARVPELEGALRQQDIAIAAAANLYTEDNPRMIQLRAEREALVTQLNGALSKTPRAQGGSVGEAVKVSSALFRLQRELNLAKSLYDNYVRYLEGTTVEDLTSTANIRMLEDPHVDTDRQIWWPAFAISIAFLLLWMAIEVYRLRPPIGARLIEREIEVERA